MKKRQRFASVWDALADTREEAANLTARTDLMIQIAEIVNKRAGHRPKLPSVAASLSLASMTCCVTGAPDFLDELVNIAAALGRRVRVEIEAA